MEKSVLVISEEFYGWNQHWEVPGWKVGSLAMENQGVPTLESLQGPDVAVVIGQTERPQRAMQLAGQLGLAVEQGLTAICLYPVVLEEPLRTLVREVSPGLAKAKRRDQSSPVKWRQEAFYEYLGAFGRSAESLTALPSHAEVLGKIDGDPVAARIAIGSGAFYLLPYQVAGMRASHNSLVSSLLRAVTAYEAGDEETLPEFLEGIRLPGEQQLLEEIDAREEELETLGAKATQMQGYRQIVGHASGAKLETLLIEVLNIVLDKSPYEAVDREDLKAEDFWIVGPKGDFALGEAKGIGGGINRQPVNQVDNHRAENNLGTDEIPGLLIVNPFRNSEDLAQREAPVPQDVVNHAVRLNVVVLRTIDVFNLLGRALEGKDAASLLIDALKANGGWLHVTSSSASLVT